MTTFAAATSQAAHQGTIQFAGEENAEERWQRTPPFRFRAYVKHITIKRGLKIYVIACTRIVGRSLAISLYVNYCH